MNKSELISAISDVFKDEDAFNIISIKASHGVVGVIFEYMSANIAVFEIASTGYRGGDSGQGGELYFIMTDAGGTDFKAKKRNMMIRWFNSECEEVPAYA